MLSDHILYSHDFSDLKCVVVIKRNLKLITTVALILICRVNLMQLLELLHNCDGHIFHSLL